MSLPENSPGVVDPSEPTGLFGTHTDSEQHIQDRTAQPPATREELLKTFVKYVPAAVAMLDREMQYLQVSDRWCADYSLRSDEILGRSHYEIFPDIPERWKQIHRRCLAGESLRAGRGLLGAVAGDLMWLRWEIRPWGERDGKPEGVLIFSEDITERKQVEATLRESEATIRTLLETAAQSILAVDLSGAVVLANRMAEEMFGYGHSEILGMPLETLVAGALPRTPPLIPRRICRQSPNSSDGRRTGLAGSSERRHGISGRNQFK